MIAGYSCSYILNARLKFKSCKLSIIQAKLLAVTTAVLNRIIVFFFFFIRSSTRIFLIFCFGFLSLPSSLFCSPFDQNFFVWLNFFHIVIFKRKKLHFVLFWKLFWPTSRKNRCKVVFTQCYKWQNFSSWLLSLEIWFVIANFEAKGQEFEIFLRSLEQFIQTMKGQNNFQNRIFFNLLLKVSQI